MSHQHESQRPDGPTSIWKTKAGRGLGLLTTALAVATIAGLALLWPDGSQNQGTAQKTVAATAVSITELAAGARQGNVVA